MIILYAYDSNEILVEPKKSRSDTDILYAYDTLYEKLETTGYAPKLNIMKNEASNALKRLLRKMKTVFQLARPYNHRRNAVERAIHTFKNNFVAGLSVDNIFQFISGVVK